MPLASLPVLRSAICVGRQLGGCSGRIHACFRKQDSRLTEFSLQDTKLPAGHPEGIFDSMGNIYNGVAREINGEDNFKGAYPTLDEGVRGMKFIEKVVESNAKGNIWLSL